MSGPKTKQQKRQEALERLEAGPDPAGKLPTTGGRVKTGSRRTREEYEAEVESLRRRINFMRARDDAPGSL